MDHAKWAHGEKNIRDERGGAPEQLVLAADIGGTKTNLAIYGPGRVRPEPLVIKEVASVGDLEEIVADFLAEQGHPQIERACFAIAGPVIAGCCQTTNLPWRVCQEQLGQRLGLPLTLLNDLAATGQAIPLLDSQEIHPLQEGQGQEGGVVALLAPGTGLGTALINNHKGSWQAMASEGGHVDFAPMDEEQVGLWRFIHHRYGHVSTERLASGLGIVNIFAWLKEEGHHEVPHWLSQELAHGDKAQAITAAASGEGEPICVKTLNLFCSILGAVAGNLALTALATGGVYLGGGIPPKILESLRSGPFLAGFVSKGRFRELLSSIPVRVILNEQAPLLGAADYALAPVAQE
ncbi:MAG: glucokinase [Thermodesulfobacteriota bacterium]